MKETSGHFAEHIAQSIDERFSFLVDAGFTPLPLKKTGKELNVQYQKDNIHVNFAFEFIPSTAIGASINSYSLHSLDLNNERLRELNEKREALYANTWAAYLRENDSYHLDELARHYVVAGRDINDAYITELANLLKKHSLVLRGDFKQIAKNAEETRLRAENERRAQAKRNKIYRATYTCFAGECEFESSSLNEIRRHLDTLAKEMPISDVLITDWNGHRIT
jgi:hypothetical protein